MNYTQLAENERYQIYALKASGLSQKRIAEQLGRSESTISRELKRNKGLRGYRPKQAQGLSQKRKVNAFKRVKLTVEVRELVELLIKKDFSPEQVCGALKRERGISLHHETVYQFLYEDKRKGGDLYTHLRIASKPYRKRYGSYDRRGKIKDKVSIDLRPAIVEAKSRIGDWEGDTIIGKGKQGALLTMVERKTLYTVIVRLSGKHSKPLADRLIASMKSFQGQIHTITFDNGLEFSAHQLMAKKLSTNIYFAHPYASWERGINENTNGLIRQYFPKGTNFFEITDDQVKTVMNRINDRPRKTRAYKTPNEMFLGQPANLLAA